MLALIARDIPTVVAGLVTLAVTLFAAAYIEGIINCLVC